MRCGRPPRLLGDRARMVSDEDNRYERSKTMSEAKQETPASSAEALPLGAHAHQPTMKEMLGELSFREWFRNVRSGLRMPRDSGEYKYAVQQMRRLWSPVCGVFLPLTLVGILMATPERVVSDRDAIPVTIEAQKANDVLKDDSKLEKPEDVEPPPPDDTNISPDVGDMSSVPGPVGPATGPAASTSTPFSPQPAAFDSVAMIKSPIKMKGVYASRSPGARGKNYGKGGGGGGGGGGPATEEAVLRALRYLKKNQGPDGSWPQNRVAMTGLVVLTFLAHGETPSESKEFGATVQKAIEYILSNQREDGKFNNMDGNEYSHPIATYALCEAYGMTLNPNVKAAAEKAVLPILKGQHPTGGWTYKLEPNVQQPGKDPSPLDGKYRDDTSYMGWCAQALKAAKMADVYSDHAALEKGLKLAVKGFQKNANPNGGFGYTEPGQGGLTAVGTLCMQLLGASNESEVKKSQDLMDSWEPSFEAKSPLGAALQYYGYYATQAKFHSGGKRWENWNKLMVPLYVNKQTVTPKDKSGYVDADGKPQDIGWWVNADTHTDRPIMDTCLAALQLMVYYRYLPTYQTAKAVTDESSALEAGADTKGDIKVDTGNL